MKVVTEDKPIATNAEVKLQNGFSRVYNKIDGSTVDVHTVDALDYVKHLPHLWSLTPIAKEQAEAEDAVIVSEPAKETIVEAEFEKVEQKEEVKEPESKPVSARSRKTAKFND